MPPPRDATEADSSPREDADARVGFTADRGDAGVRLDRVLVRHVSSLARSRTRLQALIAAGAVDINGIVVRRASTRLGVGDVVRVVGLPAVTRRPPMPQPMPLEVLFDDEWLMAVNKPAGLIVHPSYKHPDGTLVNALLWHLRRVSPDSEAPRLLHRLDKWTSGVVVAAKMAACHGALLTALRGSDAEKSYLAVTYGGPRRPAGAIRLALARDAGDRRRMAASIPGGRESLTMYERLARSTGTRRGVSLLRCRLVTGRMHQIRVHLSASGWPIVGDPLYASVRELRDPQLADVVRRFGRQALHAWRVGFAHPFTGARVSITAGLPDDLVELLAASGLDRGLGRL